MAAPVDSTHIPARFRQTAERRGDAICIFADERSWSFSELDRATDAVAAALADSGISLGDRVALLCANGPEFVIAYLGILKSGATLVPINTLLNYREVAFILADSGARGLFYQGGFETAAESALLESPEVALRVRIGDGTARGVPVLADLIEHPGPAPAIEPDPSDAVAVILYTSGTTGRPKGAMLTHANLLANARGVSRALDFGDRDRVLVVLPMFHAFAATVGILTSLLEGCGMIPVARFDPRLVSQAIARHGATIFLGVPSMYGVLLRLDDAWVGRWSGIRLCVSGGASMPVAVMSAFERRFGVPVHEGDGPTECGPVTSVNPLEGARRPGSIGVPIPSVEMCILDAAGRTVPDGETGEVCVRGPSLMKGYFNQPEATRESYFGDWFRTGDLGYRDADGYFYLVDRLKDLIITNGMNVYPRVVEEALYRHPDVAEAAVVGDPDARHGEVPVAHVALRPGARCEAADLRAWCRQHLGQHEIPRRIRIHETLPKNAAGKILKRELRVTGEHERGVVPEGAREGDRASD
ncbi:long-chain-fatty-acid--CoA ligase [Imhoffiella purpurea]|uniref:Long-chain-fatty-acid--CoA ligase n=1 Tax=Imhoffiella purpurea TaxID=1249627 RepID=W9V9V1_9GAMM|nr:long-chain fatty acid--CoA ligase [Imhoffiella purpurea]EXJ13686.1 Long-chain-fatty-acid--CoA ligase [Imhoffiella purpurea]